MRARVAALLLLLVALVVGGAAAAPAHGETGTVELLVAEASDGREVRLEVGVLYDDGDPAGDALVTAILRTPEGTPYPPVVLPPLSGARYGATIPVYLAGEWQVEVKSIGPNALVSDTFTVPEPGAATPTTESRPTTTSAEGDDAPAPILPDRSESRWSAILLGVAVFVAAIVGGFLLARRRR